MKVHEGSRGFKKVQEGSRRPKKAREGPRNFKKVQGGSRRFKVLGIPRNYYVEMALDGCFSREGSEEGCWNFGSRALYLAVVQPGDRGAQ